MTTSLVLGNMIGSGLFLLPAVLAPFGGISIIGWLVATVGAIAFALVFSQLSQHYPNTGGLYIYCREEFGEAIGFLLAWGYWISLSIGTGAIAISFTSYLSYFLPIVSENKLTSLACTMSVLWILTLVNAYSIFSGGIMQLVTTIVKIVPIILISTFGLLNLDLSNFTPFNASDVSNFSAILTTAALTFWAFIGLESASVPADNIINPKKTISLATMLGTILAGIIYISSTAAIMGLVHPSILKSSAAPFTDAAFVLWGKNGGILIGITAIIACLGAVNGWILIQGQVAYAIAKDNLLPKIFTKKSKHDAPYVAIIASGFISSIMVVFGYTNSLINIFKMVIELSTIQTLISFIFCAIARILLLNKTKQSLQQYLFVLTFAISAFLYGLFAVASSQYATVYWCMLSLLLL
jgi:APA family basic amino acid/polyamine antiporter